MTNKSKSSADNSITYDSHTENISVPSKKIVYPESYNEGPLKFKRNEFGLLNDVDYVFSEDGSVNWRSMIKDEHLFPNKSWFDLRKKDVPITIDGLKDNIIRLDNCLSSILAINPVRFTWNQKQSTYAGEDIGLIAQEVQEIVPEIVQQRENETLAIRYESTGYFHGDKLN